MNITQQRFIEAFGELADEAYQTATEKGWWDERKALVALAEDRGIGDFARMMIDGASIALIHSELSEALEAGRHGNPPDDKIPEFSGMEAELADVIIRIMDTSAARNLRVAEAVVAKMAMNKGREHKHGGKSF